MWVFTIQNFGGVQTQCLSEMTDITIDWGYKWKDKFVDLIVQFKENRNKKIDTYTVLWSISDSYLIFFLNSYLKIKTNFSFNKNIKEQDVRTR